MRIDEIVGFVIGAVVLGSVAGVIADSKGRNVALYFLLGMLLPVAGLILILGLPSDAATLEQRDLARGARKKCPHCAEPIRADANVCRYCGHDYVTDGSESGVQQFELQRNTRLRVDPARGAASTASVAKGTIVTVLRREPGWVLVR